jgi:hypothetical protein
MTKDTIVAALVAEGLTADQDTFAIPEDREAVFLVAAPGDVLPVNRVIRVELRDKVLCLHSIKNEHFWLTYDLILGLQILASKPGKDRTAGFAK